MEYLAAEAGSRASHGSCLGTPHPCGVFRYYDPLSATRIPTKKVHTNEARYSPHLR